MIYYSGLIPRSMTDHVYIRFLQFFIDMLQRYFLLQCYWSAYFRNVNDWIIINYTKLMIIMIIMSYNNAFIKTYIYGKCLG